MYGTEQKAYDIEHVFRRLCFYLFDLQIYILLAELLGSNLILIKFLVQ